MDKSREGDLYLLKARMDDVDIPMPYRKAAWRKFESIKAQIRDPKLSELRHRLVQASRDNDHDEAEKLEGVIKEHGYRMGYQEYITTQ